MDDIIFNSRKSVLIAVKYSVFAMIAIITNLLTQYLMDQVYSGSYSHFTSLLIGTLTGLLIKYFLDKKYIFFYKTDHYREDFQKFVLYSFMGLITTAVFWGFELLFYYAFNYQYAKYIGGFIGLCIGYFIKYQLDKKYVFKNKYGVI